MRALSIFLRIVHRWFIERCSTGHVRETPDSRQRVAAREARAARIRTLTGGAVAVSVTLSGVFAGIVAACVAARRATSPAPQLHHRLSCA
jgi:hypothetical protein